MCVSFKPAHFSATTLYAAVVGGLHVLGYQNTAQSIVGPNKDRDWDWDIEFDPTAGVGNAMLLPIPAMPGTMGQENVFATALCKNILQDIGAAVSPRRDVARSMLSFSDSMSIPKGVQIFETDVFTDVLADDPRKLAEVLAAIPQEKRPGLNVALLEAYAKWYPEWTMLLRCFSNTEPKKGLPLLCSYLPMYRDRLFAPALDCHTGEVPNLKTLVDVDHTVAFGVAGDKIGSAVRYTDPSIPANVRPLLVGKVVGEKFDTRLQNGDFVCRVSDIIDGDFDYKRLPPPGAPRAA